MSKERKEKNKREKKSNEKCEKQVEVL